MYFAYFSIQNVAQTFGLIQHLLLKIEMMYFLLCFMVFHRESHDLFAKVWDVTMKEARFGSCYLKIL